MPLRISIETFAAAELTTAIYLLERILQLENAGNWVKEFRKLHGLPSDELLTIALKYHLISGDLEGNITTISRIPREYYLQSNQ